MLEKLNPFERLATNASSTNIRQYRVVGADNRIFYVNSGSAVLKIEGAAHTISTGTLVYIPAYTDYEFVFSKTEMVLTVLNFDFSSE